MVRRDRGDAGRHEGWPGHGLRGWPVQQDAPQRLPVEFRREIQGRHGEVRVRGAGRQSVHRSVRDRRQRGLRPGEQPRHELHRPQLPRVAHADVLADPAREAVGPVQGAQRPLPALRVHRRGGEGPAGHPPGHQVARHGPDDRARPQELRPGGPARRRRPAGRGQPRQDMLPRDPQARPRPGRRRRPAPQSVGRGHVGGPRDGRPAQVRREPQHHAGRDGGHRLLHRGRLPDRQGREAAPDAAVLLVRDALARRLRRVAHGGPRPARRRPAPPVHLQVRGRPVERPGDARARPLRTARASSPTKPSRARPTSRPRSAGSRRSAARPIRGRSPAC